MAFQDYAQTKASHLHLGRISPAAAVGAAVLALGLAAALAAGFAALTGPAELAVVGADGAEAPGSGTGEGDVPAAEPAVVCVHVAGCVAAPGVVSLPEGSRVSDAVDAAGGLTAGAAPQAVNLARVLADGEQVVIPSTAEASAPAAPSSAEGAAGTPAAGGKVNLNTADAAELQTLSGVGAAKAAKIIAHREKNGPFKTVDDLVDVSGIGEKTLEALRPDICV